MFVLFATPCLDGKIDLDFFHSYFHTCVALANKGITQFIRFQAGICFIDHARNVLCHQFLNEFPDATDLFFIDDDIGWHSDGVLRLLEHDEDIVGGVYPLKQDKVGFPIDLEFDHERQRFVEKNGLLQASFLPTGFMRLKRHAVELMAADQPTYPHHRADGVTENIKNIFHTGYLDGQRWGEDVDFANRWKAKGGRMWVDPEVVLSHAGRKRWTASFADAVAIAQQKMAGVNNEKAEETQRQCADEHAGTDGVA